MVRVLMSVLEDREEDGRPALLLYYVVLGDSVMEVSDCGY